MKINYIWEHNNNDTLIYFPDYIGAFVRGENKNVALKKANKEIISYMNWLKLDCKLENPTYNMIQEHSTKLSVCDADTEIIFKSEKSSLNYSEYKRLKDLSIYSALSFKQLYNSIENKLIKNPNSHITFYGNMPSTPKEIYDHTKEINEFYFSKINIQIESNQDILKERIMAFETFEKSQKIISNEVYNDNDNEEWTISKICRRFIWHDRIHAKSMYKLATKYSKASNVFQFQL